MIKKIFVCDIFLGINIFLYFFLGIWVTIVVGLSSTTGSENITAEIIAETNRQGYMCIATYALLMGISVLYLIYRFTINFLIYSNKMDKRQITMMKKVTFVLSIINFIDLIFLMIVPVILTNICSTLDLMQGHYFFLHIFPWFLPIVFSLYYIITADFWNKEEISE